MTTFPGFCQMECIAGAKAEIMLASEAGGGLEMLGRDGQGRQAGAMQALPSGSRFRTLLRQERTGTELERQRTRDLGMGPVADKGRARRLRE
jgi:hypothetical protein